MPSDYKNPELMVIGDSLAQGCRSLSVTAKYCAQSYSAVIAAEQGWDFVPPAFPRPVLFDLEDIVRNSVDLTGVLVGIPPLIARIEKNFRDWCADFQAPPGTGVEYCDNLAVAGATLSDMDAFTFSRSQGVLAQAQSQGTSLLDLIRTDKEALGALHLAINSGYVLNPQRKAKYANWNALDWVGDRRPKNLIVHMGHNNGLYPIGSNATSVNIEQTTAKEYCDVIDAIEQATVKSQALIFVLLPKISSVANLAVSGNGPDAKGYWPHYRPVFSTSGDTFDAAGMKAMDDGIKAANSKILDRLEDLKSARNGNVFVIEAYDILEAKDYKNSRDPKRQIVIGSTTVDNRYIDGESYLPPRGGPSIRPIPVPVRWRFAHGGFQSIDGMHPSAVGYAEVAMELMKPMIWRYDKDRVRRTALRNEKLIGKYPVSIRTLTSVLDVMRHKSQKAGGADLPADGSPKNDTAHTIEAAQHCIFRA